MGPPISGVRLSDRPILGPAPVATGAGADAPGADAPGMLDRVKQLVGLGPSAVCLLLQHVQCLLCVSSNTYVYLSNLHEQSVVC